jgi:ribonuclease P protein component
VIRYLRNTLEPAQNRYTVIAGKKCGKSVQRNRLKRLVREALRGYHPYLDTGYDIAVICRGTVEEMPDLEAAQKALAAIFRRTPLLLDPEKAPAPGTPITTSWTAPDEADNSPDTDAELSS